MIKTKPLYINLLFTLFVMGVHAYLAQKHYLLQTAEATGQSFCNLGGVWNCDAVNTSPYSKFLGHPVAIWGFATNILFLICQLMVVLRQDARDLWADLTAYLALVILAATLVMGAITLTQLKSICLFCLAAYVFSFINFLFLKMAGLSVSRSLKNFGYVIRQSMSWIVALAIPILAFIIGSAWAGPINSSQMEGLVNDRIASWQAAPEQNFDLNLGLRLGPPPEQSKMVIVEFADFRCPHCKHAAPSIKAFVQSRSDVTFLFKTYPLDGTCNLDPGLGGQGDGISCRLAYAVLCAEKTEQKGWELFHHIFDNQSDYQALNSVAQVDQKLCDSHVIQDCDKFKACSDDDATRVMIQKMAQEGAQAGVKGTPSFYVNKKYLNGAQVLPVLEKAYEVSKGR